MRTLKTTPTWQMKLKDLGHLQVIEEGVMAGHAGDPMGGVQGCELNQADGEPRASAFIVDQGGVHKPKVGGHFIGHWIVTRSQSGKHKKLVAGTSLVTVHLVTWAGCSQPVSGDVEVSGKHEVFQFSNTEEFSSREICARIQRCWREECILEIEKCDLWVIQESVTRNEMKGRQGPDYELRDFDLLFIAKVHEGYCTVVFTRCVAPACVLGRSLRQYCGGVTVIINNHPQQGLSALFVGRGKGDEWLKSRFRPEVSESQPVLLA